MEYKGKYQIFDLSRIATYPIATRENKVFLNDLADPREVATRKIAVSEENRAKIEAIAAALVEARKAGKPAICFTGAHLIKNGMGPLLADLVERGFLTLVSGNCATTIHDFELAMIGQTSEYVPFGLEKGTFGMAYEFAYHNGAVSLGHKMGLGMGESLGRMIVDKDFRAKVLENVARDGSPREFAYPQVSVMAACYRKGIPFTVHVSLGTDVVDQHPSFDPEAKGGCSGRDFLIYAHEVTKLTKGGVALNIGSAVMGPEVLLKSVSMATNVGKPPAGIVSADFDIRGFEPQQMKNESHQNYYFRDQKSVATRIPEAYGGQGYYVQGNQRETVAFLYQQIIKKL